MWFILTVSFTMILFVLCSRRVASDIAKFMLLLANIAFCHRAALNTYYETFNHEFRRLRDF